jgi:hypothetical protein
MKIILRKTDLSFLFKLLKKSRLNKYFNKGKENMERTNNEFQAEINAVELISVRLCFFFEQKTFT